jgi:multicomponent Na+:H+ antiporter subunit B
MSVQNVLAAVVIATGIFFLLVAAIGFIRLPDLFSRLHVTGVIDTLGAPLVLLGAAIYLGPQLAAGKLVLGIVFISITSPLLGHLLGRAALEAGYEPGQIEDREPLVRRFGKRYAATQPESQAMSLFVTELLSVLLLVTALAVIRVRDLFALVVLLSVYSGLLGLAFAAMGAPDVAFTEAVVGSSLSTVFFMTLLGWVDPMELNRYPVQRRTLAMLPALGVGGVLLYGVNALPAFGDPTAPPMLHVSPEYVAGSVPDIHTPNVVTAVLGDYRAFDTMIETGVVLTAALACLLILRRRDDQAL